MLYQQDDGSHTYEGVLCYRELPDGTLEVFAKDVPVDETVGRGPLTIPAEINGKKVTSIPDRAFYSDGYRHRYTIEGFLEIPDTVTHIGASAFVNQRSINELRLGEGVVEIGEDAFRNCNSLRRVHIGSRLEKIGDGAFMECSSLKEIQFPQSLKYMGANAFAKCSILYSFVLPEHLETIGVGAFDQTGWYTEQPDGMCYQGSYLLTHKGYIANDFPAEVRAGTKLIADKAFYQQAFLVSVSIPDSVTRIGSHAFAECTRLAELQLSAHLQSLGDYAFYKCTSLAAVTIPQGIQSIGANAFDGCSGLKTVVLPEGLTQISKKAFQSCTALTEITIPGSVQEIKEDAFYGCTGLKTIDLQGQDTLIGRSAFEKTAWMDAQPDGIIYMGSSAIGFRNLPRDYVADIRPGTKYISDNAFGGTSNILTVNIPDSVVYIGAYAFTGVENLHIGDGVTKMGRGALEYCRELRNLYIGDGLTSLEWLYTPDGLEIPSEYLRTLRIGNGIRQIGGEFSRCTHVVNVDTGDGLLSTQGLPLGAALEEVRLGSSVREISDGAFQGCGKVKSIILPEAVEKIGANAFQDCVLLREMALPQGVVSLSDGVFSGCSGLVKISGISSVRSVGNRAFSDCVGLQSIALPNAADVGENAFAGCTQLQEITLSDQLHAIRTGAFTGCQNLKAIEIRGQDMILEYGAFSGCSALDTITLTGRIESIPADIFDETPWFQKQPDGPIYMDSLLLDYKGTMPEGYTLEVQSGTQTVANNAFYGCSGLERLILPDSLTKLPAAGNDEAFIQTSPSYVATGNGLRSLSGLPLTDQLKTLHIGNQVSEIGNELYNCRYLEEVDTGDGLTSLERIRTENSPLRKIRLGRKIVRIENNQFAQCSHLAEVIIDGALESIGSGAFQGCTALKGIQLPDTVTAIGETAFQNCTALQKMELRGVETIGAWAFDSCTALQQVVLPETLTTIGDQAFVNCTALPEIHLPVSLRSIGSKAFYGCSQLRTIQSDGVLAHVGVDAFTKTVWRNDQRSENVVYLGRTLLELKGQQPMESPLRVKPGTTTIADEAFYGQETMEFVYLPDSVQYIGSRSFGKESNGIQAHLVFTGAMPEFAQDSFYGAQLLVYYPADNATWTSEKMQDYGGRPNWVMISSPEFTLLESPVLSIDENSPSGYPVLHWTSVPHAEEYWVFRDGSLAPIRAGAECMYTDYEAQRSVYHTYRVAAVIQGQRGPVSNQLTADIVACAQPVISVELTQENHLVIRWDAVDYADGYEIWRAVDHGKAEVLYATRGLEMTDTDTKLGHTYTYQVKVLGDYSSRDSILSEPFSIDTPLAKLSVRTGNNAVGQPVLEWARIDGAEKYEIWYRAGKTGEMRLLTSTEQCRFIHEEAQPGAVYTYQVRGIRKDQPGPFSPAVTAPCVLSTPVLTGSLSDNGPVLTWEAVPGAEEYQVVRTRFGEETHTELTKETTFTDRGAAVGKRYGYTVSAVCANEEANSHPSQSIELCRVPATPELQVDLDPVSGHPRIRAWFTDGYECGVERSTEEDGVYRTVDTIEERGAALLDESAEPGQRYYYRGYVKLYDALSDETKPLSVVATCAQPVVELNWKDGRPEISWRQVHGAIGYEVTRIVTDIDKPTRRWEQAGTSFRDIEAEQGHTYTYQVVALGPVKEGNSIPSQSVQKIWPLEYLEKPVVQDATDERTGEVSLSWEPVYMAKCYKIYRERYGYEHGQLIATVEGTEFHETVVLGNGYWYDVKAAADEVESEAERIYHTFDLPAPQLAISTNSDGKPVLTWTAVEGNLLDYWVFCSVDGGEFESLASTRDTSLIHDSAERGHTYAYRVRAMAWTSDEWYSYNSDSSNIVSIQLAATLVPEAPSLQGGNKVSTGKPYLTWDKVDGAEKYEVYRAASKDGKYSRLWSGSGTALTNGSAKTGTTYYYKVRALAADGTVGEWSQIVSSTCLLAQPKVTVSARSDGKPVLIWDKIDGAVRYEIYFATNGSDFHRLTAVSGTKLNHTSAKPGNTYAYQVRALAENSDVDSGWSEDVSFTVQEQSLTAPALTATNKRTTGKPYLKWDKVDGAEKYEVYRATSKDGKYSRLWGGSSTALTNGSAKAGTTYYYKVRAIAADGTQGPWSEIKTRTCDLAQPDVKLTNRSDGKPVLTWQKIDGAVKYEVWRRTDGGDFSRLSTVKGTKLTNSSAKSGHTYTYKVRAIASKSAANSSYSYYDTITVR